MDVFITDSLAEATIRISTDLSTRTNYRGKKRG